MWCVYAGKTQTLYCFSNTEAGFLIKGSLFHLRSTRGTDISIFLSACHANRQHLTPVLDHAGWQHKWLIQHLIVGILSLCLFHLLFLHHVPFRMSSCHLLYRNTTAAWFDVLWSQCSNNFSMHSKNIVFCLPQSVCLHPYLAAVFSLFHLFLCSLWM